MSAAAPKFGIFLPNFGPFFDPATLADLGRDAEAAGWDGFFLWDHIAFPEVTDAPVNDPWVALAAVASATARVRLGALITPLARRRPWKLARETVTLDHLSGGRLVLGAGLGYSAAAEFAAFGEPEDARTRAELLDEGLEVLDRLWSGEPVEFSGRHLEVSSEPFLPTPLQRPRIPVWIGGWWPRKRPMLRAARWDGVFPELVGGATPSPDDVRAIARLITDQRGDGRPFDLVVGGFTEPGTAEATVGRYEGTGITWWIEKISPERAFSLEQARERILAGPIGS